MQLVTKKPKKKKNATHSVLVAFLWWKNESYSFTSTIVTISTIIWFFPYTFMWLLLEFVYI